RNLRIFLGPQRSRHRKTGAQIAGYEPLNRRFRVHLKAEFERKKHQWFARSDHSDAIASVFQKMHVHFLEDGCLPLRAQSVVSEYVMATYIYETVPDSAEVSPRRFEVRQSMLDAPLTHDPETGRPVRRVISGGFGLVTGSKNAPSSGSSSSSCGTGHCGCC
ncbi:MAG TPA: hypothetical protein VHY59_06070, partial [Chthoniobacterales bacterium]|nr:hypothetical protein [Chthoniobacterales bacterium]